MEFVFVIILALIAIYGTMVYNRLIALRQTRKNSFSDIDVQLKMRHDLIPNLLETVKKYVSHEKEVLENVTNARAKAMQAQNISDKSIAEGALDQAVFKLLAVSENYPDLKADNTFNRFQTELSGIERSIAAARRFFNNSTAEFNTASQQFPANIIAKIFKFSEEAFFELDADKKQELETPLKIKF